MTNSNATLEQLYTARKDLHKQILGVGRWEKYIVVLLQEGNDMALMKRISPNEIRWPVMCFGEQEFHLEVGHSDSTDRYYFQAQPTIKTIRKCCIRYSNGIQTFWMVKHHLWMLEQFTILTNENPTP